MTMRQLLVSAAPTGADFSHAATDDIIGGRLARASPAVPSRKAYRC